MRGVAKTVSLCLGFIAIVVVMFIYATTRLPQLSDDELRDKLANFYAQRTLTKQPITPEDQAEAATKLDGQECSGRPLKISIAKERRS